MLCEATKDELKTRISRDHPERWERRRNYEIDEYKGINKPELRAGNLEAYFAVQGRRLYSVTLRFEGFVPIVQYFLNHIDDELYEVVDAAISYVADSHDTHVYCSCPDFRYRFRYLATVDGYNAGPSENRFPEIRNPGLEGAACKHVAKVLSKTHRWKRRLAKFVRKALVEDGLVDVETVRTVEDEQGVVEQRPEKQPEPGGDRDQRLKYLQRRFAEIAEEGE